MSEFIPRPQPDDVPVNQPEKVILDGGQRARIRYRPVQRKTDGFVMPIVAVSKHPESTYRAKFDGQLRYGPSSIPPTDIDDLAVTFLPAYEFERELEIVVTNTSSSTTRTYHIQPIGFERAGGGDE